MEALALRLSHLDSHAEGAIRVVMFYDTLIRRRVDLPVLARASAGLAECVTGIRLHGTERVILVSPDGRPASATPPPASSTAPITLDEEEIGTVWLERPGPPNPLDELLLDRLAIAAAAVLERYGPARTTMADPALVELVIAQTATRPPEPVRSGSSVSPPACRSASPPYGRSFRSTRSPAWSARPAWSRRRRSPTWASSWPPAPTRRSPAGVRAGLSAAESPDRSWREARTALRFATSREPVVHYDRLGALALLAQVPQDAARDNADVAAIARLASNPEDLKTLDTYCATGSLRRAADLLHLHHSSVARRLEQLGQALGTELTEPTGLIRARLALTAWQLLNDS